MPKRPKCPILWAVEQKFIHGWSAAPWAEDGNPAFMFDTRRQALEAIAEFLDEIKGTRLEGQYTEDDYRVVKVETERKIKRMMEAWGRTQ